MFLSTFISQDDIYFQMSLVAFWIFFQASDIIQILSEKHHTARHRSRDSGVTRGREI